MRIVKLNKQKHEKGFSVLEVVLSLAIVSATMLVLLTAIYETNRMDTLAKENKLTANLVDTYIGYYRSIEVTKMNEDALLSDISDVNLVDNYVKTLSTEAKNSVAMKTYQDLDVICFNSPRKTSDSKYIVFTIQCERDGTKMNKGRPFIIKKYIKQ